LPYVFCQYRGEFGSFRLHSDDVTKVRSSCSIVIVETQMKVLLVVACMCLGSVLSAKADCVTNARGKTVCSDGTTAAAVNPNTGKAAVAQKNQNGVTTTKTSTGGTAKTKNGTGVAQGPGGTTCAKTKNNAACKPN
jgi:hypothetical protein